MGTGMIRREFITLVGGVAVRLPPVVRAQQTLPVIGFLGPLSAESDAYRVEGFRQGLNESGYVEGRNLTVDYRWAEGHYDRFLSLAADLVGRKVALIAAISTPAALAAKTEGTSWGRRLEEDSHACRRARRAFHGPRSRPAH